MLRYNSWANETLLAACRELTDAQLDHRLDVTSGSTRQLLLHLVGGQQTFVLRTMGRQHEGELDRDSDWPGMANLIDLARTTGDELVVIAERLDPTSEVTLPYLGRRHRYPVRSFLVHPVEHGVEQPDRDQAEPRRCRAHDTGPRRLGGPEDLKEVADGLLPDGAAAEYPHFAEMAAEYVLKPDYSYAAEFEFGLELILEGLERARAPR